MNPVSPNPPGAEDLVGWVVWVAIGFALVAVVAAAIFMLTSHMNGRPNYLLEAVEDLFYRPSKADKARLEKQIIADELTSVRLNANPADWEWLDSQAALSGFQLNDKKRYEVAN